MPDGSLLKVVKKAMFVMAIASVRTFDPSSAAGEITRFVENASGVAAAAVYAPELVKTEQRWLMDTGCPYDLTTRGSIPADWHTEIYQGDPVVLATANGETQCADRIEYPIAAFSNTDGKARTWKHGPREVVSAQPYILDSTPDVLSIGYRCQELGYALYWAPHSDSHVYEFAEWK